jgi:glucokinase
MANTANSVMIGIDVGATKIAAALVSSAGEVLATQRQETRAWEGAERVIARMSVMANQLIGSVLDSKNHSAPTLLGIGIGIPGEVNSQEGTVRDAVNLGWGEINLVTEIRRGLDIDAAIQIDTDANASTLGEFHFGAAQGHNNFVYLSIGSGLGSGIFVNGFLVTGATWKAADLGHVSLNPEGRTCKCGQRGCAETIVCGPGLLKLVGEYLDRGEYTSRLSGMEPLTTKQVITAAREGDELALAVLTEVGRHLGIVMTIAVSVTNPSLVVIGGGLGLAAFDLLVPVAKSELQKRVLPVLYKHLEVVPSGLDSSAIGAASIVL